MVEFGARRPRWGEQMNRFRRAPVGWSALAVSVCALTVVGMPAPAGASDPLTVQTTAGAVHGINGGTVREWRGIPYAAPPLGANRWRPPQPVVPWPGIREAGRFAPDCIQLVTLRTTEGSEDCLYLNVFAPTGTTQRSKLPVMVQLHGGSNFFFQAYKHAKALVDHGVIVVTVGYRLGVFGFAGHPALTAEGHGSSGEYGVLDQIAALRWVHHNIAGFGGNPRNVTLFGESAGSFDAVAIAASPLGRGLFTRLAAQTESFWAGRGIGTIADAEAIGRQVARKVGCRGAVHVLACLRAKPAAGLVVAAGVNDVSPWTGGVVLPRSPLALIAQQRHPVPMLVGSNREEGVFILQSQGAPVPPHPFTRKDWIKYTNILAGKNHGPQARRLYPLRRYDSLYWDTVGMYTDAIYTCPMRRLALATRGRVYRYLYTHRYQNNSFLASLRAAHFLDDPILWGDSSLLSGFLGNKPYTFSQDERALTARMSAYWTNFAKTAHPNGPGLPRWPRYQPASERAIVLDQPASQIRSYQVRQCAYLDSLPTLFP
jgi:para-nitrobenzyl esterase